MDSSSTPKLFINKGVPVLALVRVLLKEPDWLVSCTHPLLPGDCTLL